MKKMRITLLALALALSVVATSCQSGGDSGGAADGGAADAPAGTEETAGEDTPADTAEDTAAEDKGPVDLTFLDYVPSPQREEFFTRTMEGYMQENPNITIEYGSVPYEEAVAKLTTLAAAKDLPDVVNMHTSVVYSFAPAGWLKPLDEYLTEDYKNSFAEPVTKFMWPDEEEAFDGIYSIPDGLMTNGIFIRKDWVEEAGMNLEELREDWTWETYFDTVRKLTDPEKNRYGISYRGGSHGFDRVVQILVANTGGYDFDNEGNCLWYTPENIAMAEEFVNLYKDGCAPQDSVNWGFVEMVDNFTGGLTATLNNDVEVVATCMERMSDDQWAVMPLPRSSVDGYIPTYVGGVYCYGISAFSENPDEAWGYIEYISRPENNADYCRTLTMLPVRKEVDDEFFGKDGPVYGFMVQIESEHFTSQPAFGGYPDFAAFRDDAHGEWQKVLLGERTVAEVLKEYDEQATEIAKQWLADNPGKSLRTLKTFEKEIPYTGPSGEH